MLIFFLSYAHFFNFLYLLKSVNCCSGQPPALCLHSQPPRQWNVYWTPSGPKLKREKRRCSLPESLCWITVTGEPLNSASTSASQHVGLTSTTCRPEEIFVIWENQQLIKHMSLKIFLIVWPQIWRERMKKLKFLKNWGKKNISGRRGSLFCLLWLELH